MLSRALSHFHPQVLVLLAVAACDGGRNAPAPPDASTGAAADAARDTVAPETPASAFDTARAEMAPEEVGTFELPRNPADPARTKRLLPGNARIVGGDVASCTHAAGATGPRWCAFSRPGGTGGTDSTELWVMNMTGAVAGTPPACDGTSADCLRLSTRLWTGDVIYGASHPTAHRFEADTLIFHADAATGNFDPYRGAIWAWRPGWTAARKLTGDTGVLCHAEHESSAVFCIDAAIIEKDPNNPFDRPRLLEFDLRAGTLDPAADGPLPLVARVKQAAGDLFFRARFNKSGTTLLYSTVAAPGMPETIYAITTAEAGKTTPKVLVVDAAEWELAHDETKLYFLRGYDRSRGESATSALMLADFPSGANATMLQDSILWFERLGANGEVVSNVDRGLLIAYPGAGGRPARALLRDRTKPMDLHFFGKAAVAQVANDVRHTLTMVEVRGADFPVGFVNRSDGSGHCQLTADFRAETYGVGFSDSSRFAFWIEFGRNQSQSEEGWYANPATCGDRVKFGDFVGWYSLVGDDFVVFDGGDLDDSTRWLQYTSLRKTINGGTALPQVIVERPDGLVGILHTGDSVFTLFTPEAAAPERAGVFLHGPLVHDR